MKTKLITTILIFVSISIWGQVYKSILANNTAKWTIEVMPDWVRTQTWYSVGQATVNAEQYTIIRSGDFFWIPYLRYRNPSTIMIDNDSVWMNTVLDSSKLTDERYLRENGDNSKLYLYDLNAKIEYLIMDLNLSKGDTFYLPKSSQIYFEYDGNDEKKIVDSVYYSNGLKHIQLNAIFRKSIPTPMPTIKKLTFIEGVGPNLGVFYVYGGESVNPDFFCLQCFQNKDRFYGNKPCVYDYNYTRTSDVMSELDCSVEQTKNAIVIKSKTLDNKIVSLYNIMGQCLYHKFIANTDQINLNTSNFHKGIYVILVTDAYGEKLFSKKVILN